MKIALCLFGILGGKDGQDGKGGLIHPFHGYRFYKEYFIERYKPDIFIHSWSKEAEEEILKIYEPTKFIIEEQEDFSNVKLSSYNISNNFYILKQDYKYKPICETQKDNTFPYLNQLSQRSHSRWKSSKEVLELKRLYEDENNFKYDFVLLTRFDLWFRKMFDLENLDRNMFYVSPRTNNAVKRHDYDWAVEDLWFLGNSIDMNHFALLYDSIYDYCIRPPYAAREHINNFAKDRLSLMLNKGIDYGLLRND